MTRAPRRRAAPLATVLVGVALLAGPAVPQRASATVEPQAVVALIDTGINPYNIAFRDPSPLALQHPSTYIPGYPADAQALNLTLGAATLEAALAADAAIWQQVQTRRRKLYWVPGTRIVGLISLADGGVRCPPFPPYDFFPLNFLSNASCRDRHVLDDHGHGSMTASRAAGGVAPDLVHSLGFGARIVAIEGLGAPGVAWAADQGWIDVQSNSWAELVPYPVLHAVAAVTGSADVYSTFADAASKMMVFAASGNGAGGILGFAPWSTYLESTHAPGVISVGAHDNGRISHWAGAPPHVVADGYGGWMARHDTIDGYEPNSVACCTSTSAPYAAGGAARIILAARRILGSAQVGIQNGIVAQAGAGAVLPASGPLDNGIFTLAELRDVYLHTAEARPGEGRDDGLLLYTGEPRAPTAQELERGPAANPYCNGCQTLPVRWSSIPAEVPAYPHLGYGAINERSTDLAIAVLEGTAALPARPVEDALFALDQQVREAS